MPKLSDMLDEKGGIDAQTNNIGASYISPLKNDCQNNRLEFSR